MSQLSFSHASPLSCALDTTGQTHEKKEGRGNARDEQHSQSFCPEKHPFRGTFPGRMRASPCTHQGAHPLDPFIFSLMRLPCLTPRFRMVE